MNATATKKVTKTPKTKQPINGDLMPNLEGPALRFIALDAIETKDQVRTEFDDDSLAELGQDMKARGQLQPILLRPNGEKFTLIAGERRLRAARIVGLPALLALVGEVSDTQAEDMQLAENIQREDLTLKDAAAQIRKLYDREQKIDKVAAIVNKSKSWVSKHLAITCPDFGWKAKSMLNDGITDDLELLTTFNTIDKMDYQTAMELEKKIKSGKAGRKEARDILAKLKTAIEKQKAETAATKKAGKKATKVTVLNAPPTFYPRNALATALDTLKEENGPTVLEIVAQYTEEQQQQMVEHLAPAHEAGTNVKDLAPLDQIRKLLAYQDEHYVDAGDDENTVFLLGLSGKELTLTNLLDEQAVIWQM